MIRLLPDPTINNYQYKYCIEDGKQKNKRKN